MTSSENTKLIPLTQGKYAIVDAADYDFLMQWKWYFSKNGGHEGYAQRRKGKTTVMLHSVIINTNEFVDHINLNGLDNRRSNLRICSRTENARNRKKNKNSISKFKGMWRENGKWRASIRVNRKSIHLGCFDSEIEAAQAYNAAALKYHGEFARINVFATG